jgi:dTDP-4-dehydrorhamnose reductase/beta-phosphoglucomutase-like phosphatase (HAD superfamily)
MILVCGASGLVGKEICNYFDKNNVEYIGTYNKNKLYKKNMFNINFSDEKTLEYFLIFHKIKHCIFCIVERAVENCENNWMEIKKTNIDLVNITSYICNKLNIQFIHLSSDYVFDGSKYPNLPDSEKNPLQNYGISKLISEYRVIKNCNNYCIIRTPVLYSSLSKIHENAVFLIGKKIMDIRKKKCKEDNYCVRRPLYILDLCYFIDNCIKEKCIGVYHFYNPYNKFTKYEICDLIGNTLNVSIDNIVANNETNEGFAPRPYDTNLLDDKYDISKYTFHDFKNTIDSHFSKYKFPKFNIENKNDIFILIDLDGTIIDSNFAHYNSYQLAFETFGFDFIKYSEWNDFTMNKNIDDYLKIFFKNDFHKINEIKEYKTKLLKQQEINYTKNSNIFLEYLIDNNFNFCIVTNTSKKTVNIFKEKLILLNKINNWICREDYSKTKPDKECYNLAISKYSKNEKYVIGIEDSNVGYNSIKHVTDIIFVYNNYKLFENNDCYYFDDFKQLFNV